jgi:hypothetical protein
MKFISLLLLLLTGCGSMIGQLTADQISANAKDKSTSYACVRYTGTGGLFESVMGNTDKGVSGTAGGETTLKCGNLEVVVKDSGKAASPSKAASAPN